MYMVVECSSAKEAAQLCAAAAAAAADASGCLRAVRLAGASLDEAVFRPCVEPVLQPLWDASEASGLMTLERLEGLFDIMRTLANGYQLCSSHAYPR